MCVCVCVCVCVMRPLWHYLILMSNYILFITQFSIFVGGWVYKCTKSAEDNNINIIQFTRRIHSKATKDYKILKHNFSKTKSHHI